MKTHAQLWNICMDIYREMFRKSTPKANIELLIKSGEAEKPNFFMKYYLNIAKQEAIVEKHIKKNKLKKMEAQKIRFNIYLGSSPNSFRSKK